MITALLASVAPIAILIALGWELRRRKVLSDPFWGQAERLSYYILLPSLFVHGLATARLDGLPIKAMVATLVCSTTIVALLVLATRRTSGVGDPAFTSIFQGGIRFNNYVGISAAAGILGAQGVALAAVANAAIIPTVNVLCVLVFARYGNIGQLSLKNVLKQLALNPLVVASALGIALKVSDFPIPDVIGQVLKSLGQASLPLGLLCVGAALDFGAARTWMRPTIFASIFKFALMPLVTVMACRFFGLSGPAAMAAIIFQALPTASSSYIMARQLGGDAPLMAGIIAVQTVIAGISLPASVLLLSGLL